MKKHILFLALSVLFLLPACKTVENTVKLVAQDISMQDTSRIAMPTPTAETFLKSSCPYVEVVEDLGSSMEFTNMRVPRASEMISRLDITNISQNCDYSKNTLNLDLDIEFSGRLGPKGLRKTDGHPFASYPFFVAILSPTNHVLAKEIFSASLTYDQGDAVHSYRETLRHIIPVTDKSQGQSYRVLIGFQLTEEQLAYNRALISQSGG